MRENKDCVCNKFYENVAELLYLNKLYLSKSKEQSMKISNLQFCANLKLFS